MTKRIAIVLPTLPTYRKDFFELLNQSFLTKDMEFVVFHGTTTTKMVKSSDNNQFKELCFETKENKYGGYTITYLKGMLPAIKNYKPDGVVFLFNPAIFSFWSVLWCCRRRKIPYAIWSCGYVRPELSGIVKQLRESLLYQVLRKAKIHICYGHLYKQYLLSKKILPRNIFVAQNTINVEKILYQNFSPEFSRVQGHIKVLYVGALIKNKKLEAAMLAVRNLRQKGYAIEFIIVGGGKILNELQNFVVENKMESYIEIVGPKYGEELVTYFLNADVFLLAGSGGLAINEAMAYGLPVISTVGDGTVADLIDQNGFLLKQFGDIEEISGKLEKFILLKPEVRLGMSFQSKNKIKEKASLQNMVDNYTQACIKLLETGKV